MRPVSVPGGHRRGLAAIVVTSVGIVMALSALAAAEGPETAEPPTLLPAPDLEPAPPPPAPPPAPSSLPVSPPPPVRGFDPARSPLASASWGVVVGPMTGALFIVGFERTVGVAYWRSTLNGVAPPPTGDVRISWGRETASGVLTSVLAANASYGQLGDVAAPSLVPRVAFDGIVVGAGGLTLGGAVGYTSSTGTRVVTTPPTTTSSDPQRVSLLVAPRVGYLWPLGRKVTLWLRAGLAYASTTTKETDETAAHITRDIWHLELSVDPALVFSPVRHLGFLVNPFADVGVAGRHRVSVVEADDRRGQNQAPYRWSGYGLSLAMCGYW